jgi:hypothetical protein
MLLVRSYRTFAPLPQQDKSKKSKGILFPFSLFFFLERGGMFLWHYPHGHPHWALPSKFGLSGARTFLRLDAIWRLRQPKPAATRFLASPQLPAPTLSNPV